MRIKNSIFVQIASYRDYQLIPTLTNMVETVKTPKKVRCVIAWQHGPESDLEDFEKAGFIYKRTEHKEVESVSKSFDVHYFVHEKGVFLELVDIHFHEARGACWARNIIQQLYDGEEWTLQLDSHHRFEPGWDKTLINMERQLMRKGFEKPLLTAYVPSFEPENEPLGRANEAWKMDFDRFIPEGAVFFIPSLIEGWEKMKEPVPSRFYSGHFCFAPGSFAEEVQHDPEYFFHGEEISIAARAFTHGYDLFHPHKPVIYHEYTRKGRIKVWDDHTTAQKELGRIEKDWVERNNESHFRNRVLFGMDGHDPSSIDFGKYGFGSERTLEDYECYAGLSFKDRAVTQSVLDREYPDPSKSFNGCVECDGMTREEWRKSLTRSNDVRVCLHVSDIVGEGGEILDDYDFFYVGVHDENGEEIFREDLVREDIYKHLEHDWIDYSLIFLSTKKPHTYTVWVHSESQGWLNKIDRPVSEGQ